MPVKRKAVKKHHDMHGEGFFSELAVPFKIMGNAAKDTYDFVKPVLPIATALALAGNEHMKPKRKCAKRGKGIIDDVERGFKKVARKGKEYYEDAKPIIDFAKEISPVAIPLAKYLLGMGDHVKTLHARIEHLENMGGYHREHHEHERHHQGGSLKMINQDNSTTATGTHGYLANQHFNPIEYENNKRREFLRQNHARGSSLRMAGDDDLDYGGDVMLAGKKPAQKRISRGKGIISDIVDLL